jgi:hypothetical protein
MLDYVYAVHFFGEEKRMSISRSVCSLLFALLTLSVASFGQVSISVNFAPPALPIYEQPICPDEGYLWTPGYWAFADDDYYWVPGTWVLPPEAGLLWTPPYWGWDGDRFAFYDGYWGPQVGFYGGIVYGFGYFGEGYDGGRWDHDRFFYNRSVNNVNVTNIHNVYNETVINNTTVNRVSYNGGNGGIIARPRPQDETAAHERHVPPLAVQAQHVQAARSNPQLKASANQGKPPIAATSKPGAFNDRQAMPAKQAGAPYNPAAKRATARGPADRPAADAGNIGATPSPGVHPKDMQPHPRPVAPDTGNSKQDKKYQQQQEKLYAKQEQDHQKLQQKQDQEHQRMAKQQADEAKNQQMEQRHQQQTQQMEQRHAQQQQQLRERQPNMRNQSQRPNEKQ